MRQLIGARQQRLHRIGKRRGRGLKPGSDQEPQGVAQLRVAELVLLVRGCDEGRGEVLARGAALVLNQFVEEGVQLLPHGTHFLRRGRGERRVDHLLHAAVVALGDSEQRAEHAHGQRIGELGFEVDSTVPLRKLVQQGIDDLGDPRTQQFDRRGVNACATGLRILRWLHRPR